MTGIETLYCLNLLRVLLLTVGHGKEHMPSAILIMRYLLILQASLPSPDNVSATLHKFASILDEINEECEQRL